MNAHNFETASKIKLLRDEGKPFSKIGEILGMSGRNANAIYLKHFVKGLKERTNSKNTVKRKKCKVSASDMFPYGNAEITEKSDVIYSGKHNGIKFYIKSLYDGAYPAAYIDFGDAKINEDAATQEITYHHDNLILKSSGCPIPIVKTVNGKQVIEDDFKILSEIKGNFYGWAYSRLEDYKHYPHQIWPGKKYTIREIINDISAFIDAVLPKEGVNASELI